MNPQIDGARALAGTYIFDLRTSVKTLRINRFFWELAQVERREHFLSDPHAAFERSRLTTKERALINARDWIGLIRYGVNFFVLEKFARVVRTSNLEVYASMRGESLEDFLKTRLVPETR